MVGSRVTWTECLLTGLLVFGLAGTGSLLLLLAGLILLIRPGVGVSEAFRFDPEVLAFAATSATLAGSTAWRLIVATSNSPPRRGALAGSVVGFVAHPLCWSLVLAYQTAIEPSLRSQPASNILFNLVFMTLWISASSLGLVGWISIPLGAVLGYLARRTMAAAASPLAPDGSVPRAAS